jgi:hypothetical protein
MELDQTIDVWSAASARAACSARFANLMSASCTCVDTLTNRSVVHGVAVANQHVPYVASPKLQIKFNNNSPRKTQAFQAVPYSAALGGAALSGSRG